MKTFSAFAAALVAAAAGVGQAPISWPSWVERIGWTLVHSIWQLAAVAMLAAAANCAAQRSSAQVRYNLSVVALAIMLSLPVVTWFCMAVDQNEPRTMPLATAAKLVPVKEATVATASNPSGAAKVQDAVGAQWTQAPELAANAPSQHIRPATVDAKRPHDAAEQAVSSPTKLQNEAWRGLARRLHAAIEPRLPWLVCVWFAGVGLGALRPVCGVWTQWRLRRHGLSPAPEGVLQKLSELSRRMRISMAVRIAQSTLVRVPLVVGYFRPLILLPATVVTGLTAEQLEAILAHELAHVRRHDWLINALQVLAETVLFYHPAVWRLSRRLRYERELCCDDLAIGLIDDRAVFARALLLLEELRQSAPAAPLAAVTLAATGGQLSARIRRLLPASAASDRASRGWLPGAILLAALGMAGGVSLLAAPQGDSTSARQQDAPADIASKQPNKPADAEAEEATRGDAETNRAQSQPDDDAPANDKANAPQRVVIVVDEKKQPVAGATVGLQFKVTKKNLYILADPVTTDANGVARVKIPDSADRVFISVTADGFGEGRADESARGESTIQLWRGRAIRVRAVDGDGRVLKDAVPLLAGTRTWGREFKRQADGTYQSPDVALTRTRLRVACAQEQGPMLFSDLIDVSTTPPGKDGVYELTLRPGVRLEGRLDDSVPRPIAEGYVELMIVEGDQGKLRVDGLDWHDFTPVRPDGTFTFESLPGGGHAQLHVLVDGYISRNPSLEELTDYVRKHDLVDEEQISDVKEYVEHRAMWPRLLPLHEPRVTCTVSCEPTAACDFRLVDPSGKPVPDAEVMFNPNGVFLYGGLFIPGTEESQALLVDGLRRDVTTWPFRGGDASPHGQEAKRRYEWAERWFLRVKSDAEGRVRVRNLPGGVRESFHVTAKGLVLPVSPLLNDDDLAKRNAADDQDRYGMVELVSGETIKKTIYLERVQPVVNRELIAVNREGKPLSDVNLAVAELRVGEKDWQTWSTQRFGPQSRGNTDGLGRLVLRLPSAVDDIAVERVRLGVNYKSPSNERADRMFVYRTVVEVPLARDDGLIMLLPDPERPNTETASYPGVVRYGRLEDILPNASLADWLAAMVKQPNLAVLRKLLAGAKMKYPEPVELSDDNRRNPGNEKVSVVRVVSDGTDKFAIVEARARPLGGLLADESDPGRLPECSYVFDMEGNLLAALGGELGVTGSNSPDDVDLINLGPQEDWFVRVTRFEKHGPFEHLSTYYRLAKPIVNSLQYFHYANSNAWSNGPEKIVRFGTLYFDFPETKEKLGFKSLGANADGVAVIPELIWDGDRNRFVGAAAQWARNRPLYEVDAKWSRDFEALAPKANQLVVDGGERDYDYWHLWEMAVPEGCEAIVRLSIPQREGPPQIVERKLSPGRQKVQFQLKPAANEAAAKLKLWISDPNQPDKQEKLDFELPHQVGERPEASPPIFHTLNPGETARLLNRSLTTSSDGLAIDIKLLAR